MEEAEGFEPPTGFPVSVFKTGALIRTRPRLRVLRARSGGRTHGVLIKGQALYQLSYSRSILQLRGAYGTRTRDFHIDNVAL